MLLPAAFALFIIYGKLLIKLWIKIIEVLLSRLSFIFSELHRTAGNGRFPGTQKSKWIQYIRIINNADKVFVGAPGFLFCSQVFMKVCDGVSLRLEFTGIVGNACGSRRPQSGGMVNIISIKSGCLCLFCRQVFGKLKYHSADDFQMSQFFCADIR